MTPLPSAFYPIENISGMFGLTSVRTWRKAIAHLICDQPLYRTLVSLQRDMLSKAEISDAIEEVRPHLQADGGDVELVEVVELAKEHSIKVIYFEVYVSNELAKVIAKEIGARTLVLSPGANLTPIQIQKGTSFFDIMNMNLKNLQEGLDCE